MLIAKNPSIIQSKRGTHFKFAMLSADRIVSVVLGAEVAPSPPFLLVDAKPAVRKNLGPQPAAPLQGRLSALHNRVVHPVTRLAFRYALRFNALNMKAHGSGSSAPRLP